jgi:hypothetical protein
VGRKLMLDSWNQSIFSNIKQRLQVRRADAGLLEPEHLLQHQTEAPGKESMVRKLMLDSWNQSIFSNIKQRLQVSED